MVRFYWHWDLNEYDYSWRVIIFFVAVPICMFIISPLIYYWTHYFWQYRDTFVFRKRFPHLVLAINGIIFIQALIREPLVYFAWAEAFMSRGGFIFCSILEGSLYSYTGHSVIQLLWMRFYLMYFQFRVSHAMRDAQWKQCINENQVKQNWYISNQSTYGNQYYILKRLLVSIFCTGSFTLVFLLQARFNSSGWLPLSYWMFGDGCLYMPFLLGILYCYYLLWKNTPHWSDHIFIKDEMLWQTVLWSIGLVIYTLFASTFTILEMFSIDFNSSFYVKTVGSHTIGAIFFPIVAYGNSWWVIKRCGIFRLKKMGLNGKKDHIKVLEAKYNVKNKKVLRIGTITTTGSILEMTKNDNDNLSKDSGKSLTIDIGAMSSEMKDYGLEFEHLTLRKILYDFELFSGLMHHLCKSFAHETLLSFVEFHQFKRFLLLIDLNLRNEFKTNVFINFDDYNFKNNNDKNDIDDDKQATNNEDKFRQLSSSLKAKQDKKRKDIRVVKNNVHLIQLCMGKHEIPVSSTIVKAYHQLTQDTPILKYQTSNPKVDSNSNRNNNKNNDNTNGDDLLNMSLYKRTDSIRINNNADLTTTNTTNTTTNMQVQLNDQNLNVKPNLGVGLPSIESVTQYDDNDCDGENGGAFTPPVGVGTKDYETEIPSNWECNNNNNNNNSGKEFDSDTDMQNKNTNKNKNKSNDKPKDEMKKVEEGKEDNCNNEKLNVSLDLKDSNYFRWNNEWKNKENWEKERERQKIIFYQCKLIAYKLYKKYCSAGSEYEINIPWAFRKSFQGKNLDDEQLFLNDEFENSTIKTMSDLFEIFDDCIMEMWGLLADVVTVYIESDSFKTINSSKR